MLIQILYNKTQDVGKESTLPHVFPNRNIVVLFLTAPLVLNEKLSNSELVFFDVRTERDWGNSDKKSGWGG